MTPEQPQPAAAPSPVYAIQVFAAGDIYVSSGANSGDALRPEDEVEIGDLYLLDPHARALRLMLNSPGSGEAAAGESRVAPGSPLGRPGEKIEMLARYTLMADDGDRIEILLLGLDQGLFALPLSPMAPKTGYTLLASARDTGTARLAEVMSLSFARGTRITLADGRQIAVEDLTPGQRVLTRDHGAQSLRFIGRATLRAIGAFAPVVIPAGVLGNSGDLIVSQHHRMFLYQRKRLPGLSTSELLVQARHLVDGENVFLREGGFTDWFSLIFDHHEIIYAEGIPAESLMVNDATVSRLPPEIATEVSERFPGLAQVQHFGTEAGRNFLDSLPQGQLFQAAGSVLRRRG
ncbi:Hint domain-containing protein [Pseudogemmobacter faecipullorum]|uniref:Hint domain-containing protein n=1 Tax=Pseudogemmobacter faecipullorum TaxID=2755041 RepID=A0ABS8CMK7_9RHOB|nr:Hint domain-containing protein [Pseudogemmobacter faecipullorum]MCB5410607.1 Hint domain-containing protein [Pseudogemmobacter faecipullorum]